ncbi:MAG: trypsin-like peptidase domain-containing protein [Bacteriovoracaceae bacterium]|nr:trypsin-like peptidase domain-containing protein [Bacteriovoracaceae bacterium]
MKYFFLIFLYMTSSFANVGKDNDHLYKKVKPFVFQVKTSQSADSSKASYGTGFVVKGREGLLLTNYHVVSTYIQDEDNRYKIFVTDKENVFEAEVLDFSVIYDLALIKIKRKFSKELILKKEKPKRGETIYSMGLPKDLNISLVKGNYNGVIKSGIYERILMSTPVNSGMSGGPTVDKDGKVIGVNVSILLNSQNISFSVPIQRGRELIEKFKSRKEPLKRENYSEYIKEQLGTIEKNLLSSLEKNPGKSNTVGEWEFFPPDETLKCWSKNDYSEKRTFKYSRQSCFLKGAAHIDRRIYAGSYELMFLSLEGLNRNRYQFASIVDSYLNGKDYFKNVYTKFSSKKELTKFSCNEGIWTNKHDIPFKYVYCLNGFVKYEDVYSLYFKAASLTDKRKSIIVKFKVDGFTKDGILKFVTDQMDSIKRTEAM